jgi:flagellar basal-body rod modification protein FlgD
MYTSPVTSPTPGTQATVQKQLNSSDFIKMMITQLQNQDPMQPAKNEELMAQMAQIGQLQASTQLQDTLKTLTLQNQIGSAGNLIGKAVEGLDVNQDKINGLVTSVRVTQDGVYLELDSGKELALQNVTGIAPASSVTAGAASTGKAAA